MEPNLLKKLTESAREALVNSYCPYSKFPVGCALMCQDGSIIKGCNVENSAYSGGICAERTAIVKAISEGKRSFKYIAVTSNLPSGFCYPCGICRQFISEFGLDIIVVMVNQKGECKECRMRDLLPHSFGPQQLNEFNEGVLKKN